MLNNMIQSSLYLIRPQGRKPKARATRLNCGNDFGHVVANDAKAHIFSILFNDSSECILSSLCHVIRLIQDDQFESV